MSYYRVEKVEKVEKVYNVPKKQYLFRGSSNKRFGIEK